MNEYDFRTLNDKEFESFAIDLLSEHRSSRFERFKPGKDSGVDGRWYVSPGREEIVQCKHWVNSGYRPLLRHLREQEILKVARLQPARYTLITSVSLSRRNKAEIAELFAPHMLSASDILGQEDLNDILRRNEHVERRHHKLWLTSAATLSTVLNNAIVGRSRFELQQISEEASLFAVTSDYTKAVQHLNDHRVLILTGEPGIGKTTLARQLAFDHVAFGYELVVIEESVSEAEAVSIEGRKQIFYFDDFLGRTYLEALKTKQDSHIAGFLRRVSRDGSKRFILTSRTNILNQGMALTDMLSHGAIDRSRYELRVSGLTVMDRARILYSHVWHSKLNPAFIDELYVDKRYHEIIGHPNYNPRLIAFILDNDKVANIDAEAYWPYVLDTLRNPKDVWSHFFSGQLNQDSRDLVFLTVLNGGTIFEKALQTAFGRLHDNSSVDPGSLHHRYDLAIRHCTGSVLDRRLIADGNGAYSLFNPSVADFAHGYLAGSDLWIYYFSGLRTMHALRTLEQIRKESFFGGDKYTNVLDQLAYAEEPLPMAHDEYSLHLARLVGANDALIGKHKALISHWVLRPLMESSSPDPTDYLSLLLHAKKVMSDKSWRAALRRLPIALDDAFIPIDEPDLVAKVIRELEEVGADDAREWIRSRVLEEWMDQIADIVRDSDQLSDYFSPEDADEASDRLQDAIEEWLQETGIDPQREEVRRLADMVDIEETIERNRRRAYDEEGGYVRGRSSGGGDSAAVDDLFDRSGR